MRGYRSVANPARLFEIDGCLILKVISLFTCSEHGRRPLQEMNFRQIVTQPDGVRPHGRSMLILHAP